MNKIPRLAVVLVVIGLGSLVVGLAYTVYNYRPYYVWASEAQNPQTTTPITLDQAKQIAQQYLTSTGNSNLAIKEIMEFQYNFYIIYYEKDTSIGAFEMLIWKQAPPYGYGMMGWRWGVAFGSIVPEPGPNMMWNTKYGPMANGIMGGWYQASSTMTVSKSQAEQYAQTYLDANFQNAKVEMTTQFYGHYTIDFTVNGQIAGMLSVNGYTGQVWLHTWHGAFIQEVEFD